MQMQDLTTLKKIEKWKYLVQDFFGKNFEIFEKQFEQVQAILKEVQLEGSAEQPKRQFLEILGRGGEWEVFFFPIRSAKATKFLAFLAKDSLHKLKNLQKILMFHQRQTVFGKKNL